MTTTLTVNTAALQAFRDADARVVAARGTEENGPYKRMTLEHLTACHDRARALEVLMATAREGER